LLYQGGNHVVKIRKIFNDNAICVRNKQGQNILAVSKGLGFGKRIGDKVGVEEAIKIFEPVNKGLVEELSKLLNNIPIEHVSACNKVICFARRELEALSNEIFLTLIDHLSYAIERHNQGLDFGHVAWAVRELYPREYSVALDSLDILEQSLGIRMPEPEAGFIALHFLNASGVKIREVQDNVLLLEGIIGIVKKYSDFDISKETASVRRLVAYAGVLVYSIAGISHPEGQTKKDCEMTNSHENFIMETHLCVDEIATYVEQQSNYRLAPNEKEYLLNLIHAMMQDKCGE